MTLPVRRTPYLPTSRKFPAEDELQRILTQSYSEISFAVNERSIGIYDKFLLVTGNRWFNDEEPLERRQEFRRVYKFNNQAASFTIAHELTDIDFFTSMYGIAATSTNHIPLPYVSITPNASIEINVTSTNINILFDTSSPTLIKGVFVLAYVMRN